MGRCPRCTSSMTQLLSTTNEWKYYCQECDIRFNWMGDILLNYPAQKATCGFGIKEAVLHTEPADDA